METIRKNGYPVLGNAYCKPEPNCVYEDERGNIIFYFGTGKYIDECKGDNIFGCEYIYVKIRPDSNNKNLDYLYKKENGIIFLEFPLNVISNTFSVSEIFFSDFLV